MSLQNDIDGRLSNNARSSVSGLRSSPLHLSVKPRLGKSPVTLDGGSGNAQHVSRLLDRESAEVTQLYNPRFLRIKYSKGLQRVVQSNQLGAAVHCMID